MARPRLDGLTYFPHECSAHSDEEKMIPLLARHSLEGFGHYFFLLEIIYSRRNGELLIDDIFIDTFTSQAHITREKFYEILTTEFTLGLFFAKSHRELFNNSGKLIDNSGKLFNNSEKPLVITSRGVRKRRNIVMHNRLKERSKKVSDGFSPGKTPQELSRNGGKGKGKRESIKGKGGKGTPTHMERIALEKAEKAWAAFEPIIQNATPSERITIEDAISRKIFIELGGLEGIKKLAVKNTEVLKETFCARYAAIDIENFQTRQT